MLPESIGPGGKRPTKVPATKDTGVIADLPEIVPRTSSGHKANRQAHGPISRLENGAVAMPVAAVVKGHGPTVRKAKVDPSPTTREAHHLAHTARLHDDGGMLRACRVPAG